MPHAENVHSHRFSKKVFSTCRGCTVVLFLLEKGGWIMVYLMCEPMNMLVKYKFVLKCVH